VWEKVVHISITEYLKIVSPVFERKKKGDEKDEDDGKKGKVQLYSGKE